MNSTWLITSELANQCARKLLFTCVICTNAVYYMGSSVSGQDESNPALWLATRAGKMELFCPLGTTRCVPWEKFPRKSYNKSSIDQACSVKMARYWPRSFFVQTNTQKKELGQCPAILTSHLVNNPYTPDFLSWIAISFTYCFAVVSSFISKSSNLYLQNGKYTDLWANN